MTPLSLLIELMILSLLVTGCTLLDKPLSTAQHDLGPLIETAPHDAPRSDDRRMTITGPAWLDDTRLRYRQLYKAPTLVKAYSLDRWIAPPAQLLRRYFAFLPVPAETQLRIQLIDFEQQFVSVNEATSLLSFSAELVDRDKKPVKARFFHFVDANETADAQGAIKSFVLLTRQARTELMNWLTLPASSSSSF